MDIKRINLHDHRNMYFLQMKVALKEYVDIMLLVSSVMRRLYPRMNRSCSMKTSAERCTAVAATRFNASSVNVLATSSSSSSCCCCCKPPSADRRLAEVIPLSSSQFAGKMLTDVATSHRYPLSCLIQLDDINVVSASAARFRCVACHKSYSTVGGLSKHREFHCRALNAADRSQQTAPVTGGQTVSTVTKNQRCPQCDKAYTSASALKMHIRTHTLPCRCRLCGKAFSRPWLLQGHVRTHTGEKPFTCPHCQRAFADRSNLRAHLQTHYDVKQYHCDVCRRTFSRMSLLLKHRYGACAVDTDTGNTAVGIAHAQK